MPGTFVAIGLNSPRISDGASVLISHISWCGGPPPRKILMIALCRDGETALASAWRRSASERLVAPKLNRPIFRKLRREMPSQYRFFWPEIVNMAGETFRLVRRKAGGSKLRAGSAGAAWEVLAAPPEPATITLNREGSCVKETLG